MLLNPELNNMTRRTALKAYSLAMLGLSIPGLTIAAQDSRRPPDFPENGIVPDQYPNLPPEVIAEVVGKSHFDLDRVQEMVDKRPELSRSVWEWRFGGFASAIGAASHVGRRAIALYLMGKGARPTVFTFAMLGHHQVVKAAIDASPGIQKVTGPHGISLLDHAYAGERMKDEMAAIVMENLEQTSD